MSIVARIKYKLANSIFNSRHSKLYQPFFFRGYCTVKGRQWTPSRSELHDGVRGLYLDDVADSTKAVAAKFHNCEIVTPLVTPIHTSSTYRMESVEHYLKADKKGRYIYGRHGNPTVEAAECAVSALEGGVGALGFGSGAAAIATSLQAFLRPGDNVVACNPIYGGTHSLLAKYLPAFDIDVTWVDGTSVDAYKMALKPNTKVLLGETPCNPLLSILDLEAFGKLGQSLDGVITMVDSTFGSPYLQKPLEYGVDLSIHSCTKYIGGHSDVIAGVVTARSMDHLSVLYNWRTALGAIMSPHDAAAVSRGMKTLGVRMERHSVTARRLAEFLETRPEVTRVYYPGLETHPEHQLAKRQMKQPSGMIAFELKDGLNAAKTMVQSTRLIELAVSLGGTESLIEHPATMTHGPQTLSDAERREALISDGLIRLSVGLEDAEDLIKDLSQALDKTSEFVA